VRVYLFAAAKEEDFRMRWSERESEVTLQHISREIACAKGKQRRRRQQQRSCVVSLFGVKIDHKQKGESTRRHSLLVILLKVFAAANFYLLQLVRRFAFLAFGLLETI
jgi:hypothetical protein